MRDTLHYGITKTSNHMSGQAVDISGWHNSKKLKQELVLFLKDKGYYILMYDNSNNIIYKSINGQFRAKVGKEDVDLQGIETPWNNSIGQKLPNHWFFHVDRSK